MFPFRMYLLLFFVFLFFVSCATPPKTELTWTVGEEDVEPAPEVDSNGSATPSQTGDSPSSETADATDIRPGVINDAKNRTPQDEALEFIKAAQDFWQKGELDQALDTLDQAYALVISMNTSDDPKLIQQKEDLRYLISRRILEIYASRNIVVNGNHNAIPMDLNTHVQQEIDRFKGPEKDFFLASYKRSGKYRGRIVASLKEAGMPEELSWLPLIESGFKANALSTARALGLWQFIPSTGYKFGLERNTYIDQRLDFEKATAAAIAYMKEMHQMFGDWSTVLAAYNCGEGRVLRLIRAQNINYLDNFWDLYQQLPRETARYVPRFLATLHVLADPAKYGIVLPQPDPPLEFETVTVQKHVHLKDVATTVNTTEDVMRDLNTELRHRILPPEEYLLRVPPDTSQVLLARIDTIPVYKKPEPAFVYHKIRRGETLSTIARKYRTSQSSIMQANNLRKSSYIVAGKVLKIPTKGGSSVVYKTKKADPKLASATRHVVRQGDSLWNIASRYGTTVNAIQKANNMNSTSLQIGQVLRLPGQSVSTSKTILAKVDTSELKVYKVKKGDSPYGIAKSHSMTLARFLQVNNMSKNSKIYPGQKVYID